MEKFKKLILTGLAIGLITYVILSSVLLFVFPLVFTYSTGNTIEGGEFWAKSISNMQDEIKLYRELNPFPEEQMKTPYFSEIMERYATVISMLSIFRTLFYFSIAFGMLYGTINSFVYTSNLRSILKLILYYLSGIVLFIFCVTLNFSPVKTVLSNFALSLLSPLALFASYNILFFTGLLIFYIYRKNLTNKLNAALNNK